MNQIFAYIFHKIFYFTEERFVIFCYGMFCYIIGFIVGILGIYKIDSHYEYSISNLRDLIFELHERTNDRTNNRPNNNDESVDLSQ